jgi:hypothetical protein
VFFQGSNATAQHLRAISASIYSQWAPEQVLDFVVAAAMQQRSNAHLNEWDPAALLSDFCFECLLHAESVLAFEEQDDGDALVRIAYTQARSGAGAREERIARIPGGVANLAQVRARLSHFMRQPGNVHWGTQTDVRSLSDRLDVGILLFQDRLRERARTCLYNVGGQRADYPYWIALWWEEPIHFRGAQLRPRPPESDAHNSNRPDATSFWSTADLPAFLRQEFAECNRLAD